MRFLTALALLVVLLLASPAVAQKKEQDLSSDGQVNHYGGIFGYLAAAVCAIVILLVGYHMLKGMKAEAARGKKSLEFTDKILNEENKKKKQEAILFLGEKVPDWKLDNRLKATRAALKFLSCTDHWFGKKHLVKIADEAFRTLKASLEAQSAKKLEPLLTAECLEMVKTQIKDLRKNGRLRIFGQVEVTGVEIVHIEAPVGKNKHTVIALITAISKDYFKDVESGVILRGDKKTYTYQEFWCFRRGKERWLAERIRPADDMDRVLNEKIVLAKTDLDEFAKDAEPELLREFVAK